MKRLLFLAIAGFAMVFASAQRLENRSVSNFTGINASGAFEITVVKSNSESLALEANDDVMPYIRSEVKNSVLHLYLDKNIPWKVRNRTVKARIGMKNLDKVSLSGACEISASDLFTPETFNGNFSGASKIDVWINTEQLNLESSGASNIQLKSSVAGTVKVDLSGSSKVYLSGSAKNLSTDLSGASSFNAENFEVETADIESSGSSNVSINVTQKLNIESSGASTVNYKG
ncbi:MAG: DUF2807 domain-containing protein, partial [Flavobacteriaceae bacterium]|nr:DUF2807 domain-containing protein [Flavobacteriaceae bacterium]